MTVGQFRVLTNQLTEEASRARVGAHSRKRKEIDSEDDLEQRYTASFDLAYSFSGKKRKTLSSIVSKEKGLRLFSSKVCEKVEAKKTTTYNEVADELVAEFSEDTTGGVVDSVCR